MQKQYRLAQHLAAAAMALCVLPFASAQDAGAYKAVIEHKARDADRKDDAKRRPAEFLRFAEVRPGMQVLDVAAGGGATSELVALAVGFSVSVAQYLPTLVIGGGRLPTLTTEALGLALGGDRRLAAIAALLLATPPLLALAAALAVRSPRLGRDERQAD